MKITLLALAVIFLTASTFAQNFSTTDDAPTTLNLTTTTAKPTSQTAGPTTSTAGPTTSTAGPTTSTAGPTTSTAGPTTSTAGPTTPTTAEPSTPTTAESTSSDEPTNSTTDKPTTTSKAPETTSAQPTSSTEPPITSTLAPIPNPKTGYWNVTDGNTTCIRANLAIRFAINIKSDVKYIALSENATTEGSKCNTSDGSEVLVLQEKEKDYSLTMVFEKNSDKVYVKSILFTYSSIEDYYNGTHLFEVKTGNSYLCKSSSKVILGNTTMEIIYVQIQAFGAEDNKDFGSADECGADNPINDAVPIAVGIALLSLVVVVLIAYLVGRRRSRQKGYQSV